ncbi:hypothetical protein CW362_42160 [Streptomyces populi]|uniref:Uncharacterized protein n=1 Tax=Streptomyces populi TaxID=2058924 RepID=A0A2I0SB22_9ACTN|nr:hypothetical protein CW362_42160 [Streptomyces populi]
MSLITSLLILLLFLVALLIGASVLVLLLARPAWCAPVAGAIAAMALVTTVAGLLVAATHG